MQFLPWICPTCQKPAKLNIGPFLHRTDDGEWVPSTDTRLHVLHCSVCKTAKPLSSLT